VPTAAKNRLVIVESPAKAKTISGYLGPGYVVEASLGHIRDLPAGSKQLPDKYKKEPWAYLGVDVDHGFAPIYIVNPDRAKHVTKLKALLKDADELYLATDEDREGEAIAWHLAETLKPKIPVKRMVFHEITKTAIQAAVANPRQIDQDLVDAQETRRIVDRLYGYDVSQVLWKKVARGTSAGRVQSVATRIVVERERQRMAFRSATYWDIVAELAASAGSTNGSANGLVSFNATLIALDGDRIATGKDFEPTTGRVRGGVVHLDENAARGLAARLDDRPFTVLRVEEKPYRRKPAAPFITSTLQQEAARKLRFSSQQTMRTAQRLYENGYITYMRTDSVNLSESALNAARSQIAELYGAASVPPQPRRYTGKVKNAQEAHEAIRPAGEQFRTPGAVARELSVEEFKLYELIWKRTVASQMSDAIGNSVSARIRAITAAGEECDFGASGKTITDPGFLRVYVESSDDETEDAEGESKLPQLVKDQKLTEKSLTPAGHITQPPARYTEASLVKALEELGIGRPSTYASIMQTIQDRGYVNKRGQALIPSFLAFAVVGLLEGHYPRLVDYGFTAAMEDELDQIAGGDASSLDFLTSFYFGAPSAAEGSVAQAGGLKKLVTEKLGEIDAREVNSIPLFVDEANREVVVRVGRYGPYIQRGGSAADTDPDAETAADGDRVSIPEGLAPDELTPEKVEELFLGGGGERKLGEHPETGEPVVLKSGRFGPYVSSGEINSSLLKTQSPDSLTLEQAVQLLSLPRLVGNDENGVPIYARNGRYGPYIDREKDSRSLESEEQLFTVTLERALALLAEPKQRGRRAAAPPLREMGVDPLTEKPLVIKDGRFGPYVTDGEVNASLRRGQSPESLTMEQASEMLSEKRAKGPAPKKAAAAPAKKAGAAKKTTAAAKKTTAAAKKTTAVKKTTAAKKATPAKKAAAPAAARSRKAPEVQSEGVGKEDR
jgi:DNA topoisomerase-1